MPQRARLITRSTSTSTTSAENLNKGSALEFAELDSNLLELRDQTIGIVGDDSSGIDINAGDTLKIAGGTNVTTAVVGDTVTITSSGGATNAFSTIAVAGQSDVVADATTDTLTLVGGTNVTLTTNAGTDTITVAADSAIGTSGNFTFNGDVMDRSGSAGALTFRASNSADTSSDSNIAQFYFKHITYPNHNCTHTIGSGGNLVFRSSASDETPYLKLYENDDSGQITMLAKPGQYILLEDIKIADNTITTGSSNANLELSGNSSGTVVIEGDSWPTSGASSSYVLSTNGSGTLSWIAQTGGTALTGSTNNTLTTVTGSNAIQGEANATFDGSTLAITGSITATNNISTDAIQLVDNVLSTSRSNDHFYINTSGTGDLILDAGDDVVIEATDDVKIKPGDDIHLVTTGSGKDMKFWNINSSKLSFYGNYAATWEIIKAEDGVDQWNETGTNAYPDTGDDLWTVNVHGGDGTSPGSYAQGGKLLFEASADWSGSSRSTSFEIQLAQTGSTSLTTPFKIGATGDVVLTGGLTAGTSITATTTIGNDAISLDDNVIKTTRSNDTLRLAGNGTGHINISPQDADVTTAGYSAGRFQYGTNLVHYETDLNPNSMSSSALRRYANNRMIVIKCDGTDSTQSHTRFRNTDYTIVDWNGSNQSSSGNSRGGVGHYAESDYNNSDSGTDITIANQVGQKASIYNWYNANDDGNITVTNASVFMGDAWLEPGSAQTQTFTNLYGFNWQGGQFDGPGTKVITNEYGFYVDTMNGTTQWAFYDNTNGQSLFGDVKIKQNTISTNSSNANLELSGNSSGNVNILDGLQIGTSGATVTTILDEDAMGTDSATALATQQSIKAYVDASGGGVSLSGSTNNTIATVTGSNALIGEANATFDGSTLAITGAITATTNISTDAIQLVDNKIQASRSNDNLYIQPAGSGVVNVGNADWYDDFGSLISNSYGSTSRLKGNTMYYVDEAIVPGADRTYANWIQTSLKTNGADTTSSDARFRNICQMSIDLNGSSITNSNLSRGAQAMNCTTYVTSSSTDDSIISSATGFEGFIMPAPAVNGNLTVTNGIAVKGSIELDASNLGAGKTVLMTNAYGFHYSGNNTYGTGGGGTATITNSYGYYADSESDTGATKWAFYDNSASGQSKFGDVKIEGNTISTLSSNANLEIGTSGTGTIELQADTNVTGAITATTNISTDAIQLVDNKISASRSNDNLRIEASGTGMVNIGNSDFSADTESHFNNAYGVSTIKGIGLSYQKLDWGIADSKTYALGLQSSIKTDGVDTTSTNARWRAMVVNSTIDVNGASITHSSVSRGAHGVNAEAHVMNSSADDGVLSSATGFIGYCWVEPTVGTFTITNAIGCAASVDANAGGMAADKTLTMTNAFGFYAGGNSIYGGSATKVFTNSYNFYAKRQNSATNEWMFYDSVNAGTNTQSRLGAIQLINQASAPTNLADHSWIYAKDDSASSTVWVRDEAGTETKISPHNKQGEWEYYSKNTKTGKIVRVNMEKMIKKIEELTGETFIETN